MERSGEDKFWDDFPAIGRDPDRVSGAPVLKGSRIPADTLVENVEAHMELHGLSQESAMAATLKSFPTTPGGLETIRKLLAYQETRLRQLPS